MRMVIKKVYCPYCNKEFTDEQYFRYHLHGEHDAPLFQTIEEAERRMAAVGVPVTIIK